MIKAICWIYLEVLIYNILTPYIHTVNENGRNGHIQRGKHTFRYEWDWKMIRTNSSKCWQWERRGNFSNSHITKVIKNNNEEDTSKDQHQDRFQRWERWKISSLPATAPKFQFAAKLPQTITHCFHTHLSCLVKFTNVLHVAKFSQFLSSSNQQHLRQLMTLTLASYSSQISWMDQPYLPDLGNLENPKVQSSDHFYSTFTPR